MKLLDRANQRNTVGMAAFLISMSYLASRLLGLFRDRLLATHFGIGAQIDAYTAAFRLPELLFTLLVSGAFAVAFIPVLSEHLVKEDREEAWKLTSSLLTLLVVGTAGVAVILWIFADPITTLVAPGFDPYRHHLTVVMTRIMLATPVLFAISSVLGSVQQAFSRFVVYALASLFYNLGIIFGILALAPHLGVYGVAWGVVIGAGLQSLLQVLGMVGLGYRYTIRFKTRAKNVRRVLTLMVPRSIDQGIDQINYLIETIIGSRLATGSLTSYYYANNLKNVPMALIASAVTTATFPRLAARAAEGERHELFQDFVQYFRLILFLTLPTAVAAIFLRGYIVRLLFGFGSSTTAATLGWFAGAIVFQSLFLLVARVYYAMQDTKTPLMTSIAAIILNTGLAFWLSSMFGVVGLAQAVSVSSAFETLLLLVILRRRFGRLSEDRVVQGLFPMVVATGIMSAVLYVAVHFWLPLYANEHGVAQVGLGFLALITLGTVAYLVPSLMLRVKEAHDLWHRLRDLMAKSLSLN
jgi:putative peptidoglycan lipid II flippase